MKKSSVVFSVLSGVLLAGAVVVSNVKLPREKERTVMYFPAFGTDTVCAEVRYLPKKGAVDSVTQFVDELVLGPMTNRFKPLFASGTRVEFCTVEKGVCYVGLNSKALSMTKEATDIQTGVELLKVNIVKRFTEISTVLVYIDGKSVYGS